MNHTQIVRCGVTWLLGAALMTGCQNGATGGEAGLTTAGKATDVWTGTAGFDDASAGAVPANWATDYTRGTGKAEWKVVADQTAPSKPHALALTSAKSPRPTFNLCVFDRTAPADLELSVKFKAGPGEIDQGGGPVWRYQDADNYYICRANPLEDNFRLYKVIGGSRKKLASVDCEVPAGAWHTIRVTMKGSKIDCWLNQKEHLEATDDAIPAAGKIGVWTKADAATSFDDLDVKRVP